MSTSSASGKFVAALANYQTALANYFGAEAQLHADHVQSLSTGQNSLVAETSAALKALGASVSLERLGLAAKLEQHDISVGAVEVDKPSLLAAVKVLEAKQAALAKARQELDAARKALDAAFDQTNRNTTAQIAALQALAK